jgi:uncharacterized protein with PQ loop repeat
MKTLLKIGYWLFMALGLFSLIEKEIHEIKGPYYDHILVCMFITLAVSVVSYLLYCIIDDF